MEQENKVLCIYCGHATEPTSEACVEHISRCFKHPTGIALRFLRRIADLDGDPVRLAQHALFCMTSGKEGCIDARFVLDAVLGPDFDYRDEDEG